MFRFCQISALPKVSRNLRTVSPMQLVSSDRTPCVLSRHIHLQSPYHWPLQKALPFGEFTDVRSKHGVRIRNNKRICVMYLSLVSIMRAATVGSDSPTERELFSRLICHNEASKGFAIIHELSQILWLLTFKHQCSLQAENRDGSRAALHGGASFNNAIARAARRLAPSWQYYELHAQSRETGCCDFIAGCTCQSE